MKRILILCLAVPLLSTAVEAGDLERAVKRRWLGAWVVTRLETYSDCNGAYTNNRVNGNLVKSRGRHAFDLGELVKLDRIDVKRSRLDLRLSLVEPLLVPHADGPFTLYHERSCRIELEVELPRQLVQRKDGDSVSRALAEILERHATRGAAEDSVAWNGRETDPYPADYDETIAEHAAWKATRHNEAVQAKLDRAHAETARLADRVSSDPHYVGGFARGVEAARQTDLEPCSSLLAIRLDPPKRRSQGQDESDPTRDRSDSGFRDGKRFVYALEMIVRLPDCFVPAPEPPPARVSESR